MSATLHYFVSNAAPAQRLAVALEVACSPIMTRRFPDGESLVRVDRTEPTALLYCSLDHPNDKLVEVLLAASALRDAGARRVVLIAPYLCYMRQDRAFMPGEAISQRIIGDLLSTTFDALITVDPHLHRTPRLDAVVPGITAINASAAPTIARAIAATVTPDTIVIGPDEESASWVEAVAAPLGLVTMVGRKSRNGDRDVEISLPDIGRVAGHPAMLVDDLISSGATLIVCARQLRDAGATSVGAVVTHCMANTADLVALSASGVRPLLATDTVPGPIATIPIAPALADAVRRHGLW